MKMEFRRGTGHRAFLSLVAVLAGGSTFTSCDSKVKTAITSGLETTLLSLFDPANYLGTSTEKGTDVDGLFDQ
jgi:hypothetical protein